MHLFLKASTHIIVLNQLGTHIIAHSLRSQTFVVIDIEGDLGIELILGRPFLRAARARINVEEEKSASALGRRTCSSNSNKGKSSAS